MILILIKMLVLMNVVILQSYLDTMYMRLKRLHNEKNIINSFIVSDRK